MKTQISEKKTATVPDGATQKKTHKALVTWLTEKRKQELDISGSLPITFNDPGLDPHLWEATSNEELMALLKTITQNVSILNAEAAIAERKRKMLEMTYCARTGQPIPDYVVDTKKHTKK